MPVSERDDLLASIQRYRIGCGDDSVGLHTQQLLECSIDFARAVFAIAYASWVVGSYANFAAVTPAELQKFGISWSLRLTNEGGFVFALLAGLIIANVFPRFAETIKEAVRPELYIKIAIVILGATVAVTAAGCPER